jgi:hypothetical protein
MASRLQDVHLRGTAAARPAATAVAPGTLYYSTDTAVTERSSGTAWESYSDSGTPSTPNKTRQIGITVDGGGSVLTTGVKGYRSFPVAGTITGVRLLADQTGSIVIDIWKDTFANYPPTVADTITAAAKPTISASNKSEDTTLTGWTTSVSAGDVFGFNIDSVSTITRIVLELTIVIS